MKKILTTLTGALALAILIPASTFAAGSKTDVSGVVTNNGVGVNHAHVIVICDNNKKGTFTDSTGTYLVQFPAADCPAGATVYVTATKGNKGGDNTGKSNGETEKLNVAIVNVALPEFGLITAGAALVLGGGAFLAIRRRHTSGNQA